MMNRERERERDLYAEVMAYTRRERERQSTGRVVVRGQDCPWRQERQAYVKYYLWPSRYSGLPAETPVDDWAVFAQLISVHSGRHRHQGGLAIYILEGEGYSEIDGARYDWAAGDLLMLPLKPGGVEHQHFNRRESVPAKWVAFINAALYDWGGSELVQTRDHPGWRGAAARSWTADRRPPTADLGRGAEGPLMSGAPGRAGDAAEAGRRGEWTGQLSGLPDPGHVASAGPTQHRAEARRGIGTNRPENLLEWLFDLRDRQRAQRAGAPRVLRGRDLPWEWNAQGRMRWFLHPAMERTAIPSLVVYLQELPPGGRSGVQRVPGGAVLFVVRGRGYTLLDGERHDWQAEDCLNVPIRPEGAVVQHVNRDGSQPAAFLSVDLNLVHTLGVDRGSVFEQLAPAPEAGPW
jgi:quercetin dioxygenase-like cupin family protein